MLPEFLSVKECGVVFSVNEATIRRAIKRGWIAAIKIGDSKRSPYRISKKSIEVIHQNMLLQQIIMGKKNIKTCDDKDSLHYESN